MTTPLTRLLLRLTMWASLTLASGTDRFTAAALFALLVAYPNAKDIDLDYPKSLRRLSLIAGLVAASAAAFPRGTTGGFLAAAWLAYALANLVYGGIRFLNTPGKTDPVAWAEAVGHAGPVVGALAWVAARSGGSWLGFDEPIVTLTVVHFHFAFGALPLALAAWTRATDTPTTPGRRIRGTALLAVTIAPVSLGLAFAMRLDKAIATPAEAVAATLLALAFAAWWISTLRAMTRTNTPGRALATLAGLLLLIGLTLGVAWATTLAAGAPALGFDGMLRSHGVVNALGTITLATLAARFAPRLPDAPSIPDPAHPRPVTPLPPHLALFRDDITTDLGPYTERGFAAARARLLTYDIYPTEVMEHRTAFGEAGRLPRPGDAIGMLLRVPMPAGLPTFRLTAMTRIHEVADTPDRVALGYTTSTLHYGRGAWLAEITHDADRIRLRIRCTMTPTHPVAILGLPAYRWYQVRARRLATKRLLEDAIKP